MKVNANGANGYTNYNKTDSANISVKGCSNVPYMKYKLVRMPGQ